MDNPQINLNYLKIRLFIIIIIMNNQNKNTTKKAPALGAKRHYIYMVSIHKQQKKDFVSKKNLDDILNRLLVSLVYHQPHVDNKVYEMTHKYCQLHLHCLLTTNTDFRYYRYTKQCGFRVHFKKVYDLQGIQRYLRKQITCDAQQDQILDENYYNSNYGFTSYDKRTRSMI